MTIPGIQISIILALLSAALAAGGCATARQSRDVERAVRDYHAGNFESARQRLRPLAEETNENFVLNNVRLGSASLVDYELDEAEAAFLRAYEVINSVGVDDGGRTLGALLVAENIRIWRGEPFERAMANFYLGLIYYMRQDYHNARGAFENALFKLRDYGEGEDREDRYREVESNFALGYLMLAKSWQRLGRPDLARANFDRVVELRPNLAPLADFDHNEQANLLLVVDFGHGPLKVTEFDGAIVGFAPTSAQAGPMPQPQVRINGQPVNLEGVGRPPVDLLAMAQDRRWQSLDTIRTVKSAVGTGMIIAGAAQAGRRTPVRGGHGTKADPNVAAAAALIGTGLFLKATSQADVRQWEMLPRTVYVLPLRIPPGRHDITVVFPGFYGHRQTWRNLEVPEQGDEATYYFRVQRWHSGTFEWPPPAMAGTE